MQKTTKPRRKHSVKAQVQILDLTKAGTSMTLEIFADDRKLGEIQLGRGSITWYGKNRKVGKPLSWSKFADIMDRETYG